MLNKKEFREMLGEHLQQDNLARPGLMGRQVDATKNAVNRGLTEGWLCKWPDCSHSEFACGTRYGCSLVPEEKEGAKKEERYPVIPPNIVHAHELGEDGLCVYCLQGTPGSEG